MARISDQPKAENAICFYFKGNIHSSERYCKTKRKDNVILFTSDLFEILVQRKRDKIYTRSMELEMGNRYDRGDNPNFKNFYPGKKGRW